MSMKKSVILSITVLFILVISSSYFASAASNKAINNPFNKILKNIEQLQDGVNDIWNSIFGLQEQIDNIKSTPGPQGEPGVDGKDGMNGSQGPRGEQGIPGISEVRIAVFNTNSITDLVYGDTWWKMDVSCENNEFATGGSIVALESRTGLLYEGKRGGYFYPLDERTWHAEGGTSWSQLGYLTIEFELRLVCVKHNDGTSQ